MSDSNMLALYAALSAAQGEFKPIAKNRTAKIKTKAGYSYEIRYADLEEINGATRAALAKHGLSLIQPLQTETSEKTSDTFVDTMLLHRDGGLIRSRLMIRGAREFSDQKEFAAEVSYMRRYAITSMLNLAADDDAEQNGRALGECTDPLSSVPADVRSVLESLLKGLLGTQADRDALDFWNTNKAKLASSKPAYDHFKEQAMAHRRSLSTMLGGKTKQGA